MYIYKNRRFWNSNAQNWTKSIYSASNYGKSQQAENAIKHFGGIGDSIWLIGNTKTNTYINAGNNNVVGIGEAGIWHEQKKAENVYKHSNLAKANNMHVITAREFVANDSRFDESLDSEDIELSDDASVSLSDNEDTLLSDSTIASLSDNESSPSPDSLLLAELLLPNSNNDDSVPSDNILESLSDDDNLDSYSADIELYDDAESSPSDSTDIEPSDNSYSSSSDSTNIEPFVQSDFGRLIDLLTNIELAPTDSAEQLIKALSIFSAKFDDWKIACRRECGRQDRATQDLLHAIELADMDAVSAQAVVCLLKVSRLKRRTAKDNLYLIPNLNSSLTNTLKQAKGLDKRRYLPREFDWNKLQ